MVTVSSLPADLQVKWAKENLDPSTPIAHKGEIAVCSPLHTQKTPAVPDPPVSTKSDLSAVKANWAKKTDAQKKKGAIRSQALFAVEKVVPGLCACLQALKLKPAHQMIQQ